MFDRLFAPALAFMMLLGGTAMTMSGLFPTERAAAPDEASTIAALYAQAPDAVAVPTAASLERVEITVRRADALRQADEEDRRLRSPRTGAAAEGHGVMLHTPRD